MWRKVTESKRVRLKFESNIPARLSVSIFTIQNASHERMYFLKLVAIRLMWILEQELVSLLDFTPVFRWDGVAQ